MVLKTAILSEKYATDYNWYVDVILQLIRIAGDYVSDEVWHRVVQVINQIFILTFILQNFRWLLIEKIFKDMQPKQFLKP